MDFNCKMSGRDNIIFENLGILRILDIDFKCKNFHFSNQVFQIDNNTV